MNPVRLLVSVTELQSALAAGEAPTLIDVRWSPQPPTPVERYRAAHIPGARYADLDTDLAAPPGPAGRHPLPDAEAFQRAMRRLAFGTACPSSRTTSATRRSPPGSGGCSGTSATARCLSCPVKPLAGAVGGT